MNSLLEQIECIKRELKIRKSVYPKWVMTVRMGQAIADKEIKIMQSVLDSLIGLDEKEFGLGLFKVV